MQPLRTVLTHCWVADGDSDDPYEADVAIRGNTIADIGTGLDGDEEVNCKGLTITPGFIDAHVHVVYHTLDDWAVLNEPWSLRFFHAAANLRKTLAAGVTLVRDAGGADAGIKEAVKRGLVEGPEMVVAIRMISQTGGHSDRTLSCGIDVASSPYPGFPNSIADGADEMRRVVRTLIRSGADVIKVATSGGVTSPRDHPSHGHFRDDELGVLVAEAVAAGVATMAHAQGNAGVKSAIRSGIRSIEHGIYLDEEAIALMLDHDVFFVPTLSAPRGVQQAVRDGLQVPEWVVRKNEEVIEIHSDSVERAIAAGVKIAMGTDSGVAPHGRNLCEIEYLVERGLSPARALKAGTSTAASLLGAQESVGILRPGMRADLVAIEGDVRTLAGLQDRVRGVWKAGRPFFPVAESRLASSPPGAEALHEARDPSPGRATLSERSAVAAEVGAQP